MWKITTLSEMYGNNALLFLLEQMIKKKTLPAFSILSGPMGTGKTTVSKILASSITNGNDERIHLFNFGSPQNITEIEQIFFKNAPIEPIVLIFDEFQYLTLEGQKLFPAMLDDIPPNVYIIATTTEKNKILKPIVSRAQIFTFKHLSNSEMENILNDYLRINYNTGCSEEIQNLLVKKSKGIPRDLLNIIDMIFSSDVPEAMITDLLGSVEDNIIMFLFSTLKTRTIEFYNAIKKFDDFGSYHYIKEVKDFWSRFLLCRLNKEDTSLSKIYVEQLDELYNDSDIMYITKVLINTSSDNFLLDILKLNMTLSNNSNTAVVGQQIAFRDKLVREKPKETTKKAQIFNASTIKELKLK